MIIIHPNFRATKNDILYLKNDSNVAKSYPDLKIMLLVEHIVDAIV